MKLGLSHYGKDINSIREYGTAEEIWAQGGRVRTTEKKSMRSFMICTVHQIYLE
jgi:hypothetical protein